jgi:putative endonuclease
MYSFYILKSLKDFGYYIGISDNPEKRLRDHNAGKTKSLKHRLPMIVINIERYTNKIDARKREIFLKKNYQARKALLDNSGFRPK